MLERPRTTVSVAVRLAADSGRIPAVAMAPAARPVLRKVRRVVGFILTSRAQASGRAGSVDVSTHAAQMSALDHRRKELRWSGCRVRIIRASRARVKQFVRSQSF